MPISAASSASSLSYASSQHDSAPLMGQIVEESQGTLVDEDLPLIEDHKSHKQGNSVTESIYHVICVIAGSGVLQLPYALNQSGWIGILIILFAACANNYSGMLLVKCLYANGTQRLSGYPHIGQKAYGYRGRKLVEAFNFAMLTGVPIVYLILSGMNLNLLLGYFSTRSWIIISALLVLIPFISFKTLKEISILSAFGVLATIFVIGAVIIYSIEELGSDTHQNVQHKIVDFSQFPIALGSISFSYAGNFVYPEVEASMANPSQFPLVLSLSMTIISIMYLLTAVIGYAAYGNNTTSPILNNLPEGIASKFAIAVITAHVLLAIPILVTTLSLEIERRMQVVRLGQSESKEWVHRTLIRIGIMIAITSLAIMIPYFADFMALLGALANTALIFIFPVLFDFKLFGFKGRSLRDKVYGGVILAVGVFGGAVGGWDALKTLVRHIADGDSSAVNGH